VDIIAGASLARRTVNLRLPIVKTGSGWRAGLDRSKSSDIHEEVRFATDSVLEGDEPDPLPHLGEQWNSGSENGDEAL
jgi:hypothetical protein